MESEVHGHPYVDVMRVVCGLECFSGEGRRIVLIVQFGGEVREAILRERPDPFRDHDGRSRVDFGADGRVRGVLSVGLNKRVLARIGNKHRRPCGDIRLHTPMGELFVSKERKPQTKHVETDSPCRQAPMGELRGGPPRYQSHPPVVPGVS